MIKTIFFVLVASTVLSIGIVSMSPETTSEYVPDTKGSITTAVPIEEVQQPTAEAVIAPVIEETIAPTVVEPVATQATYEDLMTQYGIYQDGHLTIVFNDILSQYPEKFTEERRAGTFSFLVNYFGNSKSAEYTSLYVQLRNKKDW